MVNGLPIFFSSAYGCCRLVRTGLQWFSVGNAGGAAFSVSGHREDVILHIRADSTLEDSTISPSSSHEALVCLRMCECVCERERESVCVCVCMHVHIHERNIIW